MIEIKSLIARLRRTMKDEDENSFTDEELLDYISDGVAFIRRIILPVNPEFIATTLASGTLDKGQFQSTLPRGSDPADPVLFSPCPISIHAPSRERRVDGFVSAHNHRISIHAPSRERP